MFQIHPDFRTGHIEYKAPGSEWWVQLSAAGGLGPVVRDHADPGADAGDAGRAEGLFAALRLAVGPRPGPARDRDRRKPPPASFGEDDVPRAAE
jgi:hypothetical protein